MPASRRMSWATGWFSWFRLVGGEHPDGHRGPGEREGRAHRVGRPGGLSGGQICPGEPGSASGCGDELLPKMVFAADVRAALAYVESGNADAAFVYETGRGFVAVGNGGCPRRPKTAIPPSSTRRRS